MADGENALYDFLRELKGFVQTECMTKNASFKVYLKKTLSRSSKWKT